MIVLLETTLLFFSWNSPIASSGSPLVIYLSSNHCIILSSTSDHSIFGPDRVLSYASEKG